MTNLTPHRNSSWRKRVGVATGALALLLVLGRVLVMTPTAEAHADATFTVLYSFEGTQTGYFPSGLLRDVAGNFYGTTQAGGSSNNCSGGCGTVFKLDATGEETVLYSFTGGTTDGRMPTAGLIRDAAGNFYGTTFYGGASDFGTVYKLDTTGKETVLHSFAGALTDGGVPGSILIRDAAGNLYGTTSAGGASNFGTVYKLDMSGKETVLYSFTGGADGRNPWAGLVRDAAGNLYGTTNQGGGSHDCYGGCGTVYKLDTTGTETVLYRFAGHPDGRIPSAGLLRDAAGNLYGTAYGGGASRYGTVFKLDTTGKFTVLHSFTLGAADGISPAGLARDAAGNLYGTTYQGGEFNMGTVFKLSR